MTHANLPGSRRESTFLNRPVVQTPGSCARWICGDPGLAIGGGTHRRHSQLRFRPCVRDTRTSFQYASRSRTC